MKSAYFEGKKCLQTSVVKLNAFCLWFDHFCKIIPLCKVILKKGRRKQRAVTNPLQHPAEGCTL